MSKRGIAPQEEVPIMTLLQDGTEMTDARAVERLRRISKQCDEAAAALEAGVHREAQAAGAKIAHDAALATLAAERQAAETATAAAKQDASDAKAAAAAAKQEASDAEAHLAVRKPMIEADLAREQAKLDAVKAGLAAAVKQAQGIVAAG